MKLKPYTIERLSYYTTGDDSKAVYKRGVDLLSLFQPLGCKIISTGISRREYAQKCLLELNGTNKLEKVIEDITDPRYFVQSQLNAEDLVDELNELLYYDNYEIRKVSKGYKVYKLNDLDIDINKNIFEVLSNDFIQEQIKKCDEKIEINDFDGAITNARSLVESVLLELEEKITGKEKKNDGDLLKLYKQVQKLLNLEAKNTEYSEPLKQILSGLTSIINGIASIRNVMSDSHARTYKPSKHHAILAVNSAKTVVNFLYDTYQYQKDKGFLIGK